MKISTAGRELIERNEGLRLDAYPDPATGGDPWTIGYGDTGPDVVPGLVITREEASRRLSDRLALEFEPGVIKAIGSAPTTQGQFDAMVSLAYNIGVGRPGGTRGFVNSSIARHHAAGEYARAADAFLLYNKAAGRVLAGLTRRRGEERALYLSAAEEPSRKQPIAPVEEIDVSVDLMPAAVKMVQLLLRGAGNYEGEIDGKFGPQCEAAMREFLAWERGQINEPLPPPPPDMAQGIPEKYTFLNTVGTLPNTILHGLSLLGTNEISGQGSNPVIDSWRDELNAAYPNLIQGFSDDAVPWCGLFVALVCHRAEACSISNPLWARNWAKLGTAVDAASLGDVLVFVREGGGHVGFYVAEDDENYHVLGGNQSDSVTITRVAKSRCIAVRRPPLLSAPPASVKPYHIAAGGEVSTNEA